MQQLLVRLPTKLLLSGLLPSHLCCDSSDFDRVVEQVQIASDIASDID